MLQKETRITTRPRISVRGRQAVLGSAMMYQIQNNQAELQKRISTKELDLTDLKVQTLLSLISSKNSQARTQIELDFLRACFETNRFFHFIETHMKKKSQRDQVYRALTIRELLPSSMLFAYGDVGRHFYVVLQGEVIVMLPREMDKQLPNQYPFLSAEDTHHLHSIYTQYVVVNNIPQGNYLGEIGALHHVTRTATIVAPPHTGPLHLMQPLNQLTTILAVFEPEDFQTYIFPTLSLKIKEKVDILRNLPQFAQLSKKQISIFCAACMEQTARMGTNLYNEGHPASFLYILYHGTVEFFKVSNGQQIALSHVSDCTILGLTIDENEMHWTGAKVISAQVNVFKISRPVLLGQMERWGFSVTEPKIRKEWISQEFRKKVALTQQPKVEAPQKQKTLRQRRSTPLDPYPHLHFSSKQSASIIISPDSINDHQVDLQRYFSRHRSILKSSSQQCLRAEDEAMSAFMDRSKEEMGNVFRNTSQQFYTFIIPKQLKEAPITRVTTQSSKLSTKLNQTQQKQSDLYDSVLGVFDKDTAYISKSSSVTKNNKSQPYSQQTIRLQNLIQEIQQKINKSNKKKKTKILW